MKKKIAPAKKVTKKSTATPKKKLVVKKIAKKPVQKSKVAKKKTSKKQPVVVAVSGGFDPIHIGHVRMFQEAKALGDKLVVIINNDAWLRTKKGQEFMSEVERKEIIEAFEAVDEVIVTEHTENDSDRSVCKTLEKVKPHIFANGGDRKPDGDPIPEVLLCEKLGIKLIYNIGAGGKVQSSSWLLKKHEEQKKKSR